MLHGKQQGALPAPEALEEVLLSRACAAAKILWYSIAALKGTKGAAGLKLPMAGILWEAYAVLKGTKGAAGLKLPAAAILDGSLGK